MRLIESTPILRRSTRILRVRQISSAMSVVVTEPNSDPVGPALTSNRNTVLPSVSAMSLACSALRASCRARSASIRCTSATRPGVATSASLRGSRKLRAYPRATLTTSLRRPTFSTSLSRMISIVLARDVGQQRDLAGPLHRDRDLPLMAAARARDAAVTDLALLRDVAPQLVDVLVVDLPHLVLAEVAALAPATGRPGARPLARLGLGSHVAS